MFGMGIPVFPHTPHPVFSQHDKKETGWLCWCLSATGLQLITQRLPTMYIKGYTQYIFMELG